MLVSKKRFKFKLSLPALCCALCIAVMVFFTGEAVAGEVDALSHLKPGEWYEVPDSHLESVAATEAQFPWLRGGIGGIIDCWAGGAFDSQRDRLYIGPGGGHAGYNGNEIYAFDLHDLKWHRLNDPDPVLPGTEYTDLNKAPFAMHTYDGVQYLPPPIDRYVVIGGWGTPRTYALDPDHPEHWEVFADHGTGRTGDISAYDPVSQLLWLSTPISAGKLSQWDPLSHLWTLRRKESPTPSYYETADIDYKRRLLVSCGKGKLKTFRLTALPAQVEAQEIKTVGDADALDAMNAPSPGFCYVPPLDRFVAWSKGADVYTLDLDAKRWTKHPPAPSNTVIPGPAQQWGTFGRFRYVASKNVFILCNSVKQNVFIYRMTADVPNVMTGVEAQALKASIDSDIPGAAIAVIAKYADGSQKDVTADANYFSLDPAVAEAGVRGHGSVKGLAPGTARIRAVYTDPAFQRGFSSEVTITVNDAVKASTLETIAMNFPKATVVAGDSFQLEASASYVRGADRFKRRCTDQVSWSSDAPDMVTVSKGLLRAIRPGGPVTIHCSWAGQTATAEVRVTSGPTIRRISFQVQSKSPRAGWDADNGQPYTKEREYGWLDTRNMAQRDDRKSARHQLLMRFVVAQENKFKLNVPSGQYLVRIAMGDADYGAVPFDDWTALGSEKLVYYAGHHNSVATKLVTAAGDSLEFTVKGPINYLIVAPVGIDLDKYADDGPGDVGK